MFFSIKNGPFCFSRILHALTTLRLKKCGELKSFLSISHNKTKINRKEVIQPHLPIRLPCYDLAPVTNFTLGPNCLETSSIASSHRLTGGVYKARERIHGGVADPPLLAIPASWSRIADSNPN